MDRGGPWLAAIAAVCAALPGLAFPFLSDDWHLVASVGSGAPSATPYGYFRPLYTATFWLDRRLWGLSPFGFHLTNLVLMAAAAFLVVVLVRRHTGEGAVSAFTGLLFALHPYHVENAAWIAVRGDPLYSVLFLGSAWAYDRWRRAYAPRSELRRTVAPLTQGPTISPSPSGESVLQMRGVAAGAGQAPGTGFTGGAFRRVSVLFVAWTLFELALLAKETAVVLPALLLLVTVLTHLRGGAQDLPLGSSDPPRSTDRMARVPLIDAPTLRAELLEGILPMGVIALLHFFVLRPLVMPADASRSLAPGTVLSWARHALGFVSASILPIDAEILAHRPLAWGGAAALGAGALAAAAWLRHRRLPAAALAASVAFVLLLAPSIIGFQERYLFLPLAASSLFLASLVAALRPRVITPVACLIILIWIAGCVRHWRNWSEAAAASRHLVADLVRASEGPNVQEIALANMPFRVRGGSVAGDLRAAIALSGGRPVPVTAATYVSYPRALAPALRAPGHEKGTMSTLEVRAGDGFSEVRMWIQDGPFSHYVAPTLKEGPGTLRTPVGTLVFESKETVLARIEEAPDRGRAAYAWAEGRLIPLFLPPKGPSQLRLKSSEPLPSMP